MIVFDGRRRRIYALTSLCLMCWWMQSSSGCVPPDSPKPPTYHEMGFPSEIVVGSEGCDTVLSGDVPFEDMYAYIIGVSGGYKKVSGRKYEACGEEFLESGWLHVRSVYSRNELRITIDPNRTEKERDASLHSPWHEIRVVIVQEPERRDSIAETDF